MNHKIHIFNPVDNQRGIALLITIAIIAILFAVSMELNRRVRTAITAAEASKANYKLMETARSGISIAKAVLIKDAHENRIDSVQEDWARPDVLNKIVKKLDFDTYGEIKLKITDEMGKIQVNALINEYPGYKINQVQKQIWENLLSFFISSDKSEDKRDPNEIINCLIDWLDDKDGEMITGISGAESAYYESLKIPYKCANREICDLNELFFVKGFSKDILSRTETFNNMFADQEKQEKQLQLSDLLTVFGVEKQHSARHKYYFSGKININTAPVPVIAAILPLGKQDLAKTMAAYRVKRPDGESDYTNNLSIKNWFADIVGLSKREKNNMAKIITYSTNIFSIESTAQSHGRTMVLKSFVLRERDKQGRWYCKTLRQQIE